MKYIDSTKRFSVLFVLFLAVAATTFFSCNESKPKTSITIGNEAWTVNRTLTYLTKAVLERKGIEVKVKNQNIEKIFKDLAAGSIDLYMDAWDDAHYVYIYEHEGLEDLDEIYEGCQMGMAVPNYFDVDSISDLKKDSSAFDNIFYGLNKDAGAMISSATAMKHYQMNPKVIEMNEDDLLKQLQLMVDKKQNFVVSAWKPHWKIEHFGLKFLVDTSGSYNEEDIRVYGRPGFKSSNPEVAEIVSKMYLNDDQMTDLLLRMKDASDEEGYEMAVKSWMEENQSVVNGWLGN